MTSSVPIPRTERKAARPGPYLAKVSEVKEVKGVEKVALLHGKLRVAGREERADVLQTQELQRQQWRSSVYTWKEIISIV